MLVKDEQDVYDLLDSLLREPTQFWDSFYKDRKDKEIPFFCNRVDEHLKKYVKNNMIQRGRVLEIGCGNGRNAIYLAKKGFSVTAVDLSQEAINWATQQASLQNVDIEFYCENIFNLKFPNESFDFIYDSGCFHHLPPHRRITYIQFLHHHLKHDGYFSISTFKENGKYGGSALADEQYYIDRSLHGGIGYSKEKLKKIFKRFEEIEIRDMHYDNLTHDEFGLEDFVVCLFKK
ncbi:class I SAM-dependent methyltransferase [Solibacillus sp. MA9]|uniref:Class I SAM-dependent methyltransferase n=1 Tax=Solibacillus palustris TaxID=2908203 RepID=A0ABS9UBL0_9BACL|nr:class I SAM-dependent methyltransferase [Solibacillus sp. MA9]MCH7321338.1 class I SAM-dependent methyltransferase [Solibacillus sp. MA9]